MKRNLLVLILSIFSSTLIIWSCGSKKGDEANLKVFRYNEAAGITSLDPAFSRNPENIWACNHIYNGLLEMDDQLKVQASIAKSWEISEDGKTYTFYLRNNVYFHDNEQFENGKGRKVTAHDFVYSFNRILDSKVASPGTWIFNNVDFDEAFNFQPFEAIDDTTLKIHLSQPFPPFLGILTMQYCAVVAKEVVEYYKNDYRSNPVGTGPFMFKVWDENNKLVLLKNPNYWEKDENGKQLPYIDAISISFVKDKEMEFLKFLNGELHFVSGRDGDNKESIFTADGKLKKEYNNKIKMLTNPYLNTEYLGILVDDELDIVAKSPLRKKYVRQAINYGFDRKQMISYLRKNIGTPAEAGFVPKGLPSYDDEKVKGYNYNPEKAKELLYLAGYPNGDGMPVVTLFTTANYVDLCEFIQHQLGEIGIKVKVDVVQATTHRELVARSKLNFFRKSWIADYPDAENYLALFYSKNFTPHGPNYTHFKSIEFDNLYELSQKETNDSIRYDYYQRMDNIIIEEAPVVILYYDEVVRLTQTNVENLGINPINLLSLKKVKLLD
ncbi:MAG: ABC transporter substrate-binding protein [Flavobacteriales bacterium]|nr:ABC transporter substrate-binding protein [Flavobacteriales bacterium]MCW8912982.1 ABC transporter substrate-binding protein [Flavobacteriales bacterium]MCW8938990.1 ABC transporter substrate-binding protein [Flavobacteriales bacterium]MCW8969175.1 ABC transporter substrate-binding protein [Flavobacteriales bacterium]MCW8988983.1 ABC transporter substrate-binding protein [Flavobacteriales bacterium]